MRALMSNLYVKCLDPAGECVDSLIRYFTLKSHFDIEDHRHFSPPFVQAEESKII
jgi:hypothetical protein